MHYTILLFSTTCHKGKISLLLKFFVRIPDILINLVDKVAKEILEPLCKSLLSQNSFFLFIVYFFILSQFVKLLQDFGSEKILLEFTALILFVVDTFYNLDVNSFVVLKHGFVAEEIINDSPKFFG